MRRDLLQLRRVKQTTDNLFSSGPAEKSSAQNPSRNEVIYFELPDAIGEIQSLKAEVHLYLFATLPSDAMQALSQLGQTPAMNLVEDVICFRKDSRVRVMRSK